MFKKKENGFSLVELAVAAAIATALAVVAVSVVTGTATSVSEKGSSAAAAETCTISESLKGGTDETINDCGTAGNADSGQAATIVNGDFMWAGWGLYIGGMSTESYDTLASVLVPGATITLLGYDNVTSYTAEFDWLENGVYLYFKNWTGGNQPGEGWEFSKITVTN